MARDAVGDLAGAIDDYTQALSRRVDNPRLLRRRGWSHLAVDAHQLAVIDFDKAVRLERSNADAHAGRGFARARLGNYRAAVKDAEQALQLDDKNWRTAYNAARVYVQAAVAIRNESRKGGPITVSLYTKYQARAVALLREALRRAPAQERTTIFRDTFQADPTLQLIRTRLGVLKPN
jgi:tetratricopeptide (TPR) repeat protein